MEQTWYPKLRKIIFYKDVPGALDAAVHLVPANLAYETASDSTDYDQVPDFRNFNSDVLIVRDYAPIFDLLSNKGYRMPFANLGKVFYDNIYSILPRGAQIILIDKFFTARYNENWKNIRVIHAFMGPGFPRTGQPDDPNKFKDKLYLSLVHHTEDHQSFLPKLGKYDVEHLVLEFTESTLGFDMISVKETIFI